MSLTLGLKTEPEGLKYVFFAIAVLITSTRTTLPNFVLYHGEALKALQRNMGKCFGIV